MDRSVLQFETTRVAARHAYGLYIHTPFCETKCGYCDFYSVAMRDRDPAPLVDALITEMGFRLGVSGLAVRTIFIGGGTPTVLPTPELARLLAAVAGYVHLSSVEEFTVEANPATVDDETARVLVSSGVTRVSMGAQSFIADELTTLERLHTPGDISASVATLRRAGAGNMNLDLIFAIPGQTLQTWSQSLRSAVELGVEHLACYGLTYEPGTRLTSQRRAGRVTSCDENLEAEMFDHTADLLANAGFEQYEISNYAKPERRCLHNLIYWRNQPYIGIGPSAAGYTFDDTYPAPEPQASACANAPRQRHTDHHNGRRPGRRYRNVPDVARYVQMIGENGHAETESETVEGATLIHEMILMQLRLSEGLSIDDFRWRTGIDPTTLFGGALDRLVDQDLLTVTDARITLTRPGRLVADSVMADLAACVGPSCLPLPVRSLPS